jgi:hypothetical protein
MNLVVNRVKRVELGQCYKPFSIENKLDRFAIDKHFSPILVFARKVVAKSKLSTID